ncbi:MAG: type II secretion system F family protein [Gammaproteobacteria bacterium]|nr:type II secretion system F family protein [Gammaproteobacteria bacterium]MBU2056834.1 type II secretion system F family protein [Gammaproteobacteria bacterium]MBU2174634.1 type II secretion system F family protein [Gammaproteobacteria bacterium]MBU2248327.1 type II secretion system F family protein [Gammaproteobacteria bacterium]MBU2346196.1 type II secretion system F family protein [Gammaproteobacteria bacterium]
MATFSYTARDRQGQSVSGSMEAGSEAAVADMLLQRSQTPIKIKLQEEKQASAAIVWPWQRVNMTELIIFARQMYSLMKAGIPIIRAIVGLAESTSSAALNTVLLDLADQLEKGRTLSAAMAQHPQVFSRLVVSIVHVGENTGRLDESFLQLSGYFEQEMETKKQIKQATRYPTFVLVAITIAMVIMNILVIPQFATMFAKFNTELPWATKVLLASSSLFVNYWQWMAGAVVGLLWALKLYLQTDQGRYQWSYWKLKMPLMGTILVRASLGRFSRSFAMMLRAGVPLTSALTLVAEAVDNDFMAEKIRDMRKNIERGESLLRVSVQSELFTPLVLQMLAVGEETGQVDEMLTEVASFYEREVAYDLKGLTAKIEPILISVVSGMVLILALGIFTPMWDMLNAYKGG